MLIFLGGPILDGGGATFDKVARIGMVFALFATSFFDTLAFSLFPFHLGSLAARKRAWSISQPNLLKNTV
jgi:hypothetical protein